MAPALVPANGVPHLTERQKEIVILIAEDLSAKEISQRLGISPKTAVFHRQLIKERLHVTGTAGIVRYAIKAGLIQP
jgi:DNA-binding CsgD family transcriptional regulator